MVASSTRNYALELVNEAEMTRLVECDETFVVLLPVGSVEPHGPHMSLVTDTVISEGAAERAAVLLDDRGIEARIAPAVPYGVTECAKKFHGAVSVPADVVSAFLRAVVEGFLATGVDHVCLINNHLEPGQDRAVRAAIDGLAPGSASVACPLTRRWGRTLSAEFKSGACHAGRYETSIVLARDPALVDEVARAGLPAVDISLSEKLRAGVEDFLDMGLERAYAGAPAEASAAEGHEILGKLAVMVATEVLEALGRDASDLGA